jgi:hypothetical protein
MGTTIPPLEEDEGTTTSEIRPTCGRRHRSCCGCVAGEARMPTSWWSSWPRSEGGKGYGSMTASTQMTTRTTMQTTPNQTMTRTTMTLKNNGAVGDWPLPTLAFNPPIRPPIGRRMGGNDHVVGGRGECNDVDNDVGRRRTSTMPLAAAIVMQCQSILCSGGRAGVFAVGGWCVEREGGG